MLLSRLEQLYRRPLVLTPHGGRTFPIEFARRRKMEFYPTPPLPGDYDMLEIGPGNGDFLVHLATAEPHARILAIEIGNARFIALRERLKRLNIAHVTLARGDARVAMEGDFAPARFKKIAVLFPDPWPRNRHRHRRLMTPDFTRLLCDRLVPGGEFIFATDVADYADWVTSHLDGISCMRPPEVAFGDPARPPIATGFEKKWRSLGRECQHIRRIKSISL